MHVICLFNVSDVFLYMYTLFTKAKIIKLCFPWTEPTPMLRKQIISLKVFIYLFISYYYYYHYVLLLLCFCIFRAIGCHISITEFTILLSRFIILRYKYNGVLEFSILKEI